MLIDKRTSSYRFYGNKNAVSAFVALYDTIAGVNIDYTNTSAEGNWELEVSSTLLVEGRNYEFRFYGSGLISELPTVENKYKGAFESFMLPISSSASGTTLVDTQEVLPEDLTDGEAIVDIVFDVPRANANYEIIRVYVTKTVGGEDVVTEGVPFRSSRETTKFKAKIFSEGTLCYSISE